MEIWRVTLLVARVEERHTAMGRLTVGISAVLSAGAALRGVKR